MSYGSAAALQAAVYQHLVADAPLDALVSGAIYDAVPGGTLPELYVSIGPEDVRDRSDATGGGALHVFTISVVENGAGFARAKAVSAAVSDALVDASLTLTRGTLVFLRFDRARARRVQSGQSRRIDLSFRAMIDDT
ncbi:gene transfer agent protein [Actibacterium mucosum KCTC 23349]|uniref:Gene transfer agent protein n=1 Tax=Actibacterium mucosum KCTC 23349 TaxID=1454373 RepID=A0A037ZLQ7_9RHOB|nr:DUF3168 domain-containing protein [Actibacterium mucosum]KAJ56579.1 gene transfer agent protein [Actibacterium mucosum KCTC 23349]